jgi:hypothetical protein
MTMRHRYTPSAFQSFALGALLWLPNPAARAWPASFAPVVRDSTLLSTITTDTGDLAPGNKTFTRYTKPALCVAAANDAADVFRHTVLEQIRARQVRRADPSADTIPAHARAIARTCGTRFTVEETTADDDLRDLFTLALLAGNDSLARAALERRVARAGNDSAKAAVLQWGVTAYLAATPARVPAATGTAERLDALGPSALSAKLEAHAAQLRFATARFDERTMLREADRVIALAQGVPMSTIRNNYGPLLDAYRALGQVAYVEAPDSVMAIVARAKADLSRVPLPATFSTMSLERLRNELLPFNMQQYASRPLPPVVTPYWFPAPPDRWPPGAGRLSLVIYSGDLLNYCVRSEYGILEHGLEDPCSLLHTTLPHWAALYGETVSITLVAQTRGHAARSIPLPPSAEADTLAWFLRDHLKLPVTVGVVLDSVGPRSPPNTYGDAHPRWADTTFGRDWIDTTAYGKLRDPASGASLVVLLYDVNGQPRYFGRQFNLPLLQALLDRETRFVSAKTSH